MTLVFNTLPKPLKLTLHMVSSLVMQLAVENLIRGGFNVTMGATKIGASMMKQDNVGKASNYWCTVKLELLILIKETPLISVFSHKVGAYTIGVAYFNSKSDLSCWW